MILQRDNVNNAKLDSDLVISFKQMWIVFKFMVWNPKKSLSVKHVNQGL